MSRADACGVPRLSTTEEVRLMLAAMFKAREELGTVAPEHVFEAAFEAGWLAKRESL